MPINDGQPIQTSVVPDEGTSGVGNIVSSAGADVADAISMPGVDIDNRREALKSNIRNLGGDPQAIDTKISLLYTEGVLSINNIEQFEHLVGEHDTEGFDNLLRTQALTAIVTLTNFNLEGIADWLGEELDFSQLEYWLMNRRLHPDTYTNYDWSQFTMLTDLEIINFQIGDCLTLAERGADIPGIWETCRAVYPTQQIYSADIFELAGTYSELLHYEKFRTILGLEKLTFEEASFLVETPYTVEQLQQMQSRGVPLTLFAGQAHTLDIYRSDLSFEKLSRIQAANPDNFSISWIGLIYEIDPTFNVDELVRLVDLDKTVTLQYVYDILSEFPDFNFNEYDSLDALNTGIETKKKNKNPVDEFLNT